MNQIYEYVPKEELKSARLAVEKIIKTLQSEMKKNFGITFKFDLLGSAGRKLVTRKISGNRGFDFDYNFYLQKFSDDPNFIWKNFFKVLNDIVRLDNRLKLNVNSRSITVKFTDKKNSRIIHSCDFAIIKDNLENTKESILYYEKDRNRCYWNEEKLFKNIKVKTENIIANGLWGELREQYLDLKNINNDEKTSLSLYYEAINNVYNNYDWE